MNWGNLRNTSFLLLFSVATFAQQRGLYVDKFSEILGDSVKEISLLTFAKQHHIEKLNLYELHQIAATNDIFTTKNLLTNFIVKARKEFDIKSIGVSGENAAFFRNTVITYNQSRSNRNEKLDFSTLEFEFWTDNRQYYCEEYLKNQEPCTNDNLFKFYLAQIKEIEELAHRFSPSIELETYVGRPMKQQIEQLAPHLDRILIHAYRDSPKAAFADAKERMKLFKNYNAEIKTSIIFSAEPHFMQSYLRKNSLQEAENSFLKHTEKNMFTDDFIYFCYSFLR